MRLTARSGSYVALFSFAVGLVGCDVYEKQRIDPLASDAATRTPDASSMDASQSDAASMSDASEPDFDPSSCSWGECWWSTGGGDGECKSAGKPTDDDRPDGAGDGSSEQSDIYLGFTEVRLGTTDREGVASDDGWADFGLDLDGTCTNASTCPTSSAVSCRSSTDTVPFDGQLCRDNTLARLQPVVADVPEIGERYGISEGVFNCALWRGSYNYVLRISSFNGKPNDSRVRVDYYLSMGTEDASPWNCDPKQSDFHDRYPRWRSSQRWRVDEADLTTPISESTSDGWPDSKVADADAYVKNGYLVTKLPEGAKVGFIGNGSPHRGFILRARQGVIVGRLSKVQDGTWSIRDGLTAGRIRNQDLTLAFREVGFCEDGDASSFYKEMVAYVEENADVLASGDSSPSLPCDAMSFAIGFEAAQLAPGRSEQVPPRIECCPPDKTDEQCSAKCGDGRVTGDEKCDTAIAAGSTGACPTACAGQDGDACALLTLQGSKCTTACAPSKITEPKTGDGCCPEGASSLSDGDCMPLCGNAVVEAGETCDLPGTCPTCTTTNACLARIQTGAPETCDVRCMSTLVSACKSDDGCCPMGCSRSNDRDCSDSCGNRRVESDETCENETDQPCATNCDDGDGCTEDQLTGSSANCNVRCEHTPITQAAGGDACCPEGATSKTDSDCSSECGNAVVEAGEECDDGNDSAGDGCNTCKREDAAQICLARLGENSACSQCTCKACADRALACQGASDAEDVKLCDDMVQCARESGCRSDACYCGNADLLTCLNFPNGMCRAQVMAAAKTSSPLDIQSRQNNSAYPLGRAVALGACVDANCAADCL